VLVRGHLHPGDLSVVDEVVAEDFVAYGPGDHPGSHGAEAFKDWLRWYRATFTDPEWTVHDVIVAGEACWTSPQPINA
jgi:hypothetical protein